MDLPSAIERIRPAVFQVRVQAMPPGPLQAIPLGTAFLVSDDGWLITARHVIDDAAPFLALPANILMAAFAVGNVDTPSIQMRANFVSGPVTVQAMDDQNDLALLRLVNAIRSMPSMVRVGDVTLDVKPGPAILENDRPTEGEGVAVSGYPLNEAAMVTNAGSVASSWAWDDDNKNDRYLGDFTANPGNSGGPVYRLSDASVIGVCVAGKLTPVVGGTGSHAAALTIVVPSKFVSTLLDANDVNR